MGESERDSWNTPSAADGLDVDAYLAPRLTVEDYNPLWTKYFLDIRGDLISDLEDGKVTYLSIEHVGSTSVRGLASKAITEPRFNFFRQAIIDICIVVAKEDFILPKLEQFKEALLWGSRQVWTHHTFKIANNDLLYAGGYHYIGDGGVQDRWSFKVRGVLPLRNLYVTAEGSVPLRAYISLRETLRVDADLRHEYEEKKRESVKLSPDDEIAYCKRKRQIIRKIFLKDGWTNEEVDEAEEQSKRDWPVPTPADIYDENGAFGT